MAHTAYTDSTTVAASKPLPLLVTVVVRGAVIVVAAVADECVDVAVKTRKVFLLVWEIVVDGVMMVGSCGM